uniref:Uncharacterized protein n=1 Tax=Hyaloperonospora arabidopsidis (strain Emoy2) TaxID=559515 RepID=M4BBN6_HYAAE
MCSRTRVTQRSKGELKFYFLVLSVINLIQLPNTKVKLIHIVIFSILRLMDGTSICHQWMTEVINHINYHR